MTGPGTRFVRLARPSGNIPAARSPGRSRKFLQEVDPSNQRPVVELLARATDTSVRHAPGFILGHLHRSLDGTKVTMYAQWRTIEDYQAMRGNPGPSTF